MGARARVQQDEVEEVGSEEDDVGFLDNDSEVGVDCGFAGEGWGEGRGNDRGDEVVRYDDQLLGGEDGAGEDAPRAERGGQRQRDATTETAAADGMDVARGYAPRREDGRGDSSAFVSGDGLQEGADTVNTTIESETSIASDRNEGKKEDDVEKPAPPAGESPAVQLDPGEALAPPTTSPAEPPQVDCHQNNQQQDTSKESSTTPPPRTPVRPRTFSASTFSRGPPSSSSFATASGGRGKWRPSFGGSGGGADGSVMGRSPGAMYAPWAAFSTPLKRHSGGGERCLRRWLVWRRGLRRRGGGEGGGGGAGRWGDFCSRLAATVTRWACCYYSWY